jgi:SpoVK/Ycf46/Vps4 family AAA+-type ATPase
MTTKSSRTKRQLRRAESASAVPAIDRAVAAATCKLLIAMDRLEIDPVYFSRSVAACQGSWVWPEAVIRYMVRQNETHQNRPSDSLVEAWSAGKARLRNLAIPDANDPSTAVQAGKLVDPEKILAIKSGLFHTLATHAQHRLQVAHETLTWLSEAPDPANELPFLRNARYLGVALGLDASAKGIIELMSLVANSDSLKLALAAVPRTSMNTALSVIARWVGGHKATLETLFFSNGALVQCGLHTGLTLYITNLEEALQVNSSTFVEKLNEVHASEQSFIESFLHAAPPTCLSTEDISHLERFHALARSALRQAGAQRTRGMNVLLYGPPGTGKTEYAKLLAKDAGLKLYEVPFSGYAGASVAPGLRLGSLIMALKALECHQNSAVLLDEAEDIFEPPSKGDDRHSNQLSKAWLNNFLETAAVPVIWSSNAISQIDPATLRRFALVQEIGYPPQHVRSRLARTYLSKLPLEDADIQSVSRLPMLTPGSLELTARTVMLAQPTDRAQALSWVQDHLKSSRTAQGMPPDILTSDSVTKFDLRFANICDGPRFQDLLHFMTTEPRMSLCLYGIPGTGKTEFAHYLADQLGRDVVTRSGGDLMSKYVGETEQNIARMFDECADSCLDTVLLLDEADTFLRKRQQASRSWEVSQTNEFLARMGRFPGTFVCTTNLFDELDPAILRRFQFRMRFAALRPEQASVMFETTFGLPAPAELRELSGLVPADYANVKRQLRIMRDCNTAPQLMQLLKVEAMTRQGRIGSAPSRIGFLSQLRTEYA